jgi:hypothetical protein
MASQRLIPPLLYWEALLKFIINIGDVGGKFLRQNVYHSGQNIHFRFVVCSLGMSSHIFLFALGELMRTFIAVFVLLAVSAAPITGKTAERCAEVLVPTEEQTRNDYSMMQAYMKMSSSEEYERLRSLSQEKRAADASYKLVKVEYDESQSKEQFKEKIEKRLSREVFSMSVSDARAVHRRYLSETQIQAWSRCMDNTLTGGSVLLVPRSVSPEALAIRLNWIPQQGTGAGNLSIKLVGGQIDGKPTYSLKLIGRTSTSLLVKPDIDAEAVTITANIEGNTDDIRVLLRHAATKKEPIEVLPPTDISVIICSGNNACRPGDWGVGTGFPTPNGDCSVSIRADELSATREVESIRVIGVEPILGEATAAAFSITKTEMHPSAYTDSTVRKNLLLCGYVKSIQDRRAILKLRASYK